MWSRDLDLGLETDTCSLGLGLRELILGLDFKSVVFTLVLVVIFWS